MFAIAEYDDASSVPGATIRVRILQVHGTCIVRNLWSVFQGLRSESGFCKRRRLSYTPLTLIVPGATIRVRILQDKRGSRARKTAYGSRGYDPSQDSASSCELFRVYERIEQFQGLRSESGFCKRWRSAIWSANCSVPGATIRVRILQVEHHA